MASNLEDLEDHQDLETLGHLADLVQLQMLGIENCIRSDGRRWYVRPLNAERKQQGAGENLIQKLRIEDDESFFNFTRLTISQFDELLQLIGPSIQKISNRKSISPESRLLVTLRFLATGNNYRSLHYIFRIGHSTIRKTV